MPIPLKSSHKDGKVYIVQLEIGPAFARQKNAETAVIRTAENIIERMLISKQ